MLHISAIQNHFQAPLYKESNSLPTNKIVMLLVRSVSTFKKITH
jgi:hypothetical protein